MLSQDVAAASIFLAAKVEEFPVHIKSVLVATYAARNGNERHLQIGTPVSSS